MVDTANLNGKIWLNEGGEIVSYAEHVIERFTADGPDTVRYEATVTNPVVYTRPWTIAFSSSVKSLADRVSLPRNRPRSPHLKALKDLVRKK